MDATFLVKLTSKAWALPILAQMGAGVPGRQAALQSATGASRTAFGQSLSHLIDLRVVEKNPGHGHPLRPEYQLTPLGAALAPAAGAIVEMSQDTTHPTLIRRMWILPLLASLQKPQTFTALATKLTPITDRALSQALQHLQMADWITRDVDISSRPPRATYQSHRIGAAMGQHCLALLQSGSRLPRPPASRTPNQSHAKPPTLG